MMETTSNAKLEKMIGKIRRLLDMASHPGTPVHEAESAAAKAQELMQQYNLEEAQVCKETGKAAPTPIVEKRVNWYKGRTAGAGTLLNAVAKGFFCHPLTSSYAAHFVGRERDATIAAYVFQQLDRRLWELALEEYKKYAKEFADDTGYSLRRYYGSRYQTERLNYIHAFISGAAHALYRRLAAKHQEFVSSTALVVTADKDIKTYLEDVIKPGTYKDRHSREGHTDGFNAGVVAGNTIKIHEGLPTSAPAPSLTGGSK